MKSPHNDGVLFSLLTLFLFYYLYVCNDFLAKKMLRECVRAHGGRAQEGVGGWMWEGLDYDVKASEEGR